MIHHLIMDRSRMYIEGKGQRQLIKQIARDVEEIKRHLLGAEAEVIEG
jgi:hypothetical protein